MDLTPLLIWWFILLIFGLVGWPLAFSLLRHLPDRGFAFARPVALLLTGYILWLGGTFRLLQNNVGGILVALLVVLALGLVWRRQRDASMLAWLKQEWRYVLAVELLFNLALVGWTIFKAYNPNIETAGGEKWMETAFVNATLRSTYFPPQDPWLSGFAISYYYFGYVLMAMLTRLSGVVSTIAFNLYIPTLLAMTLSGAFGIVVNLVSLYQAANGKWQIADRKSKILTLWPGFMAALSVGLLGNLEGLLEVLHKRGFFTANFWTWLDIRDLKIPPPGADGHWLPPDLWTAGLNLSAWLPDRFIWWWRASRVLTDYSLTGHEQEVIDEFPFFSFMLGDVHPHVLALPFVLLVVALALNLLVNPAAKNSRPARVGDQKGGWLQSAFSEAWFQLTGAVGGKLGFVLYAVCLGSLSFLNTWDFPIYLGVVGLAWLVWLAAQRKQAAAQTGIIGIGLLGVVGVALYLPFYLTFQSQARGLLPNLWNPTRLPQFFVFFGPFLVAVIVLLLVLSVKHRGWASNLNWSLPLALVGPVLIMLVVLLGLVLSPAGRNYIEDILRDPQVQAMVGDSTVSALAQASLMRRLQNPWTFLLVGSLVGWALALLMGELTHTRSREALANQQAAEETSPSTPYFLLLTSLVEKFVLILILVGLGLTLAVEFVYLRDNFGIRMNTIFKFYFQAWVLLALASAFAVYYVSKNLRGVVAALWYVGITLLVAGGLVYPVLATLSKADYFHGQPTLNGIAWMAEQHPGDYAAIEWLRAHAPDEAVILEAPGDKYAAYQYVGRVSAMTGLPTLLGWGGHESQWRGNYDEPARREPDIKRLFNTTDLRLAQDLLNKYHITYVYVGSLERERYSPQGLKKFGLLMDIVFDQDGVTIYQRR